MRSAKHWWILSSKVRSRQLRGGALAADRSGAVLHDEFSVSLDETSVSRALKKLGYVKLTARPRHHAQNEHAMEAFKKGASLPNWQRSGRPSRRARP